MLILLWVDNSNHSPIFKLDFFISKNFLYLRPFYILRKLTYCPSYTLYIISHFFICLVILIMFLNIQPFPLFSCLFFLFENWHLSNLFQVHFFGFCQACYWKLKKVCQSQLVVTCLYLSVMISICIASFFIFTDNDRHEKS